MKKRSVKAGNLIAHKKLSYICHDGPMAGQILFLESPKTLTLTFSGGRTGFYRSGKIKESANTLFWHWQ